MCYVARVPTADVQQLDRVFHALADANRRAMVRRLTRGAASVGELAAPLGVSLPTVLQHLGVLEGSGLVRSEKVGRVRTCELRAEPLRTIEGWIGEHRAAWDRRLDLMGEVLDDAFPDPEGNRTDEHPPT
jgi:DNA-binding transcriptional ArsR family regulator